MNNLRKLRKEFENELTDNILNYWVKKVYDPQRGNFIGYIGPDEKPDPDATLGAVLISRILWTFSAAYQLYPTAIYKMMADEAFRILSTHFWDDTYGGIFWEVSPSGSVVNDSKQIYAQSFGLYAFAEYARIFENTESKQLAIRIFHLIEAHAYDTRHGGYFESTSRDWKESARKIIVPAGEKMNKSMNTHLHILEAFTNLYRICVLEEVRNKIFHVLEIFDKYIINPETHHFHMFFDSDWSVMSTAISYGHDIEGSWLLWEAAEVLHDKNLMEFLRPKLTAMAKATGEEALDPTGGLYNESDHGHWDRDFHWWPQAEAVVGFFNAYHLTGDKKFLNWSENSWKFIQKYQIDHQNGDWFWLISPEYNVRPMVKVSAWKCPYHNGRMCMEMIRRIREI